MAEGYALGWHGGESEGGENRREEGECRIDTIIHHPPSCSVSNQSIMVNHTLQSLRPYQAEETDLVWTSVNSVKVESERARLRDGSWRVFGW